MPMRRATESATVFESPLIIATRIPSRKFRDCLLRFGPNLILDGKSTEQFPFGDDVENCLSLGRPLGRRLFHFCGYCRLALGQQPRSPDNDVLAFYLCSRTSTR